MKRFWPYCIIGSVIVLLDRITKKKALDYCAQQSTSTSFVRCELTFNRGISWGLFHSSDTLVFYIISFVIACITGVIAYYAYNRFLQGNCIVGEMCVIAGSLSNLIDRVLYQGVIDFILISCNVITFPVFNGADIAIVTGVAIIFLSYHYNEWFKK